MGVIGALALAANVGVALLLYRYRTGDANMRSVWICSRNDAIGNVAVMLARWVCSAPAARGRPDCCVHHGGSGADGRFPGVPPGDRRTQGCSSMTFLVTPIIFLVHIAEEWRHFPDWATRHFGATSRAWYVYSHIFLIAAISGICAQAASEPTRMWTIWAVAVQWASSPMQSFISRTWLAVWRIFARAI